MDSLLTLIDRWAEIDEADTGNKDDARHALELRLVELTSYLEGMSTAIGYLNRPLLLLKGDRPS